MKPMANIALRIAREAATYITRAYDRPDRIKVEEKSPHNYVTNVDRDAEAMIIEGLKKTYIDHAFIGEESGRTGWATAEYVWVIDALDGTTNFIHGIPHFAISIACLRNDRPEHAIIIDPIRLDEFVVSRGDGCRVNGRGTRVTVREVIAGSIFAHNGTRPRHDDEDTSPAEGQGALTAQLLDKAATLREAGSAALDLAYVASGRFDGVWMSGLKPWDMAAGILAITESGGLVSDFTGGGNYMETGNLVAANPKCFRALLPLVRKHLLEVRS